MGRLRGTLKSGVPRIRKKPEECTTCRWPMDMLAAYRTHFQMIYIYACIYIDLDIDLIWYNKMLKCFIYLLFVRCVFSLHDILHFLEIIAINNGCPPLADSWTQIYLPWFPEVCVVLLVTNRYLHWIVWLCSHIARHFLANIRRTVCIWPNSPWYPYAPCMVYLPTWLADF